MPSKTLAELWPNNALWFTVYCCLDMAHGLLIGIDREQWLKAVQFGVRALSQQTPDVTVVGFSLGGALAT